MPLEIAPCTPADFPRCIQVEREAWKHDYFMSFLFPGPFPENAASLRINQMTNEFHAEPQAHWLKVIDSSGASTGNKEEAEGIAFAKFFIYDPEPMPVSVSRREFGPGTNEQACEMVFGGLCRHRERLMGGKRFVFLNFLVTDPLHQRRGAGSLLTNWAIEQARRLGIPAFVESTVAGHAVYEKCGFRDIEGEKHEIDLSALGAEHLHLTWAMIWNDEK